MGLMPHKWRNRIITRCSSNVNVAIFSIKNTTVTRRHHEHSTGRTVLPFGLTQNKEQPRLLRQLSRFYLLPFLRKKLGDLRTLSVHNVFSLKMVRYEPKRVGSISFLLLCACA